jgi:hypothetical protein
MPLKTPFRHLTQFPLNNPLYLLRITIESVTANRSMSALGQKRTFNLQPMPLYPQKRTLTAASSMSALCQKRTFAYRLKKYAVPAGRNVRFPPDSDHRPAYGRR